MQILTITIPTYSCTLKIVEEVDGKTKMKLKHSYVTSASFPGCHVLIQSGEIENQGEVKGFEGDALYSLPEPGEGGIKLDGL